MGDTMQDKCILQMCVIDAFNDTWGELILQERARLTMSDWRAWSQDAGSETTQEPHTIRACWLAGFFEPQQRLESYVRIGVCMPVSDASACLMVADLNHTLGGHPREVLMSMCLVCVTLANLPAASDFTARHREHTDADVAC